MTVTPQYLAQKYRFLSCVPCKSTLLVLVRLSGTPGVCLVLECEGKGFPNVDVSIQISQARYHRRERSGSRQASEWHLLITMACDLRFSTKSAKFVTAFGRRGFGRVRHRLDEHSRLIGQGNAMMMMMMMIMMLSSEVICWVKRPIALGSCSGWSVTTSLRMP